MQESSTFIQLTLNSPAIVGLSINPDQSEEEKYAERRGHSKHNWQPPKTLESSSPAVQHSLNEGSYFSGCEALFKTRLNGQGSLLVRLTVCWHSIQYTDSTGSTGTRVVKADFLKAVREAVA